MMGCATPRPRFASIALDWLISAILAAWAQTGPRGHPLAVVGKRIGPPPQLKRRMGLIRC